MPFAMGWPSISVSRRAEGSMLKRIRASRADSRRRSVQLTLAIGERNGAGHAEDLVDDGLKV